MNQTKFADLVHLNRTYLSELESGRRELQPWLRERIAALELEPVGQSDNQVAENPTPYSSAVRPAPKLSPTHGVPVVSWARAGMGTNFHDVAEQIDEWLETDSKDPNAYALIIEGDSMMPEFKPGDRVIFEPNLEAQNGDVVVARLYDTGQVYFKLFHLAGPVGDQVRLTSFNPAYPPLEYPKQAFRFIHPMRSMVRYRRR